MIASFACVVPLAADPVVNQETRVIDVRNNLGLTGQGVAVGIMDRGIDWKNIDFRNADGSTRIAAILDLTDDTGATSPNNPYGKGTLYTRAQINNALSAGTSLATRDAVGHGTATAGNCCGNGRNSNGKYTGIAPNATLIIAKITSDGVPAHDDQPAEAAFWDPSRLPIAIDFLRDTAAALGMPIVMLPNIGSTSGPADGTSAMSRKIDSVVGPTKPGVVFLMGSGDDGSRANHAEGDVSSGGTTVLQVQKSANYTGGLYLDLWYADSDRFSITIDTPNGSFGPYAAPANNSYDHQSNSTFDYYHNGSVYTSNSKRVVYLTMNSPGIYQVRLTGTSVASTGHFQAALNPTFFFDARYADNKFLSNVVAGYTINDYATAFNNIVPNSYELQQSWIDIDGVARSITNEGVQGDLWAGSSVGPTWDGRLGIDVSAPGENAFVTYNPKSYWATSRFNLIQDGGGLYGRASAVSSANPIVTGIVALMLEKNPSLTGPQAKTILQNTARRDQFTGSSPNSRWGYGKVDALAAVNATPSGKRFAHDFNGDGKSDILWRNTGGSNALWLMNGATVSSVALLNGVDTSWAPVGQRDFDGDGKTDILWRNSGGSNAIWFMNGATVASVSLIGGVGPNWSVVGTADLNGDGKGDIIWRNTDGTVAIWLMNGATVSSVAVIGGIGTNWSVAGIADFDGDGKGDILWRENGGSNAIWFMNGAAIGSVSLIGGVGTSWTVAGTADFNGDGKGDILWREAGGTNAVWLMNGATVSSVSLIGGVGTTWTAASVGDYNGDGKGDILWREAGGSNAIWFMNGGTVSSVSLIGGVATNWSVQNAGAN